MTVWRCRCPGASGPVQLAWASDYLGGIRLVGPPGPPTIWVAPGWASGWLGLLASGWLGLLAPGWLGLLGAGLVGPPGACSQWTAKPACWLVLKYRCCLSASSSRYRRGTALSTLNSQLSTLNHAGPTLRRASAPVGLRASPLPRCREALGSGVLTVRPEATGHQRFHCPAILHGLAGPGDAVCFGGDVQALLPVAGHQRVCRSARRRG